MAEGVTGTNVFAGDMVWIGVTVCGGDPVIVGSGRAVVTTAVVFPGDIGVAPAGSSVAAGELQAVRSKSAMATRINLNALRAGRRMVRIVFLAL